MRRREWLQGLAALALPAAGLAFETGRFDPARDAAADLAQALAAARAQRRHVIVDVGGEWCAWCHVLDRFVRSEAEVRAAIEQDYLWLKVNYSPSNRNERVLAAWPKVAGYPHLFVLDGDGRLVASQPCAALEAGKGYDRGRMLAFLAQHRPAVLAPRQ
jgi:thiol:disulfide interchange protein